MNEFKDQVNNLLDCAIDVFGEDITYYPVSGGSFKLKGVFDQNYQAIDPDTEQVISANQMVLGLNLNDLSFEPKNGDLVRIQDSQFRVIDSREDGQGGTSLMLHRTDDNKTTDKRAYSRFT